ncbi:MAG: hypothetical protein COV32_00195 [Candidatus Yonathbacteria bacterium CG10_big_fil_rev_8_21_14_0_10_43_136]|uniref:HicB family protein n=2 Tax=Parcubacteria group TaxID=1794811 RepID=A0A2M7Q5S1_9BACT|nr:MAG: hypothetical protein AUK15_03225 [Candidatus Nomurabacteria bacterium CG2_30_43_9]PIQ35854.1 MAG: hypothetical protein COW60_01640 [Candidatus Yonathbacteria bacterium CG17_big_fil_post_rev_8_21_14_2_50_43_9]PIR40999.1 MAG: hypothetical protein COV32_00195 [Candidatus Yonathbacteria bacterium CG10_big_fil_rev_8_21_14_0_10_43_136]PIX57175.1 MAG: hypothetical protein COZ48_02055 [Candidatus Yonathbacteria bacterium CG_4_10_14_3_um_filter_43_12]PIY58778.1 MAG: hypothetical protein COY98_00
MKAFKNTLQKGSVRYVVFKEKDTYFGVALEFNVVVEGASQIEAIVLLNEAVQGYLESARKSKLRPQVLNQSIESEYEKMWQVAQGNETKKRTTRLTKSPYVLSSGQFNLAFA